MASQYLNVVLENSSAPKLRDNALEPEPRKDSSTTVEVISTPTTLRNHREWRNNTHPQWWRDHGLRINVLWIGVLYFGFFTWGYSTSLLNVLQPLPQFNEYFNYPSGGRLGLIYATLILTSGHSSLAPAISWSNDKLGRKRTISLACLIIIAGTILGTLARSTGMLIASRVIIGSALPFMSVACVCLVNETAHPRLRGICATINSSMYFGGVLIVAWVTFGTLHWSQSQIPQPGSAYSSEQWAWRLPLLLQALGPVTLLSFSFSSLLPAPINSTADGSFYSFPESPRWLVAQGRVHEAHMVLARGHANGDLNDELVLGELNEIRECLFKEKEESTGKGAWESWKDLWKTRGLRKRMIVVTIVGAGSQLKGTSAVASYITPILNLVGFTNPSKIAVINGCLTTCDFVSAIAGALCVNSVGRRPLWLISTAGLLVCFAIMTALAAVFSHNASVTAGYAFIAVMFILRVFNGMGWSPLTHNYPAEILPYSIRSRALSYFTLLETSILALNLWLHPVAFERIGWKYLLVFVGFLSALMVAIWTLFIETRGRTIEQVSILFDMPAAEQEKRLDNSSIEEGRHEKNCDPEENGKILSSSSL